MGFYFVPMTMSYTSRIKQSKEKVYHHAIATKIRDMMGNLRKSSNESRKRRWIWELLQNAKDAAFPDQKVRVEVNHQFAGSTGYLSFSHNGKPFSVDDVTFLVEQVSTKDQKIEVGTAPKKTGKFGTGFLTTHLLSERVDLNAVLKEADLPYRKFKLILDRTGRTVDEIIKSVETSLALLDTIDVGEPMSNYQKDSFNTNFQYQLSEKSNEVAKIGLDDLSRCIPFTLAFNPVFQTIQCKHEETTYQRLGERAINDEGIRVVTIKKTTRSVEQQIKIVVLSEGLTTIAIEIEESENSISIKEFDDSLPRLFCDFPLVGSEDFYFPTVINDPSSSPTEPRDGIDLTDNEDIDIENNKSIIGSAIKLYYKLLDYAADQNWQNTYILARVFKPGDKDWLSVDWFESSVRDPIREKILRTPMVDLEAGGRSSMIDEDDNHNIYFPNASDLEVREKIWELSNSLFPGYMPRKSEIDQWYEIAWSNGPYKQTIHALTEDIDKRDLLSTLANDLNRDEDYTIKWLNSYYDLLNLEKSFINEIINDKFKVIPNQNGVFKVRSELYWDYTEDASIKEALKILGDDPKEYLRDKRLITNSKYKEKDDKKGQIMHVPKKHEELIDLLNKILGEGKNEHLAEAANYLISLFSDDKGFPEIRQPLYDFCLRVFGDLVPAKDQITKWHPELWKEVDKIQVKWLVTYISKCKNVETLSAKLTFHSESECLEWLDEFITFLNKHGFDSQLNLKTSPILPNQNGTFLIKDDIFLDDGNIDSELKDISRDLGHDFREELLEKDIFLELPPNRTKDQSFVAEKIITNITPKFSEYPRTETTKQVFRKLFVWITKNKETAAILFSDLVANKHRLYDDEEIAENMQKAEVVSDIMAEFGITSMEQLRETLEAGKANQVKEQITKETLASLGVTSIEELEAALSDEEIASRFFHTSTPTVEMFLYAQTLIERAKKNIIKYLRTDNRYDCTDLEEIATTVLAGIKKQGLPINIVVRPSDNGEVIVYYASEKDALDYEDSELWIENGIEAPKRLSLGKILKITGINRIPVRQ